MVAKKETKQRRDKFVDKARELGCDEDEAAFEAKLKLIAKAKPTKKSREQPKSSAARGKERGRHHEFQILFAAGQVR